MTSTQRTQQQYNLLVKSAVSLGKQAEVLALLKEDPERMTHYVIWSERKHLVSLIPLIAEAFAPVVDTVIYSKRSKSVYQLLRY